MVKISFVKQRAPFMVAKGSNLMRSLVEQGLPVATSCQGEGICTKCRVEIVEGRENLSKINEQEESQREVHDIPREQRLSCQTKVLGDIVVDTGYW